MPFKLYHLFLFSLFFLPTLSTQGQDFNKEIKSHRKAYKKSFLTEERSPLHKKEVRFLNFFNPDQNYQVKAVFTTTPDSAPFDMATYSGITKSYRQYGTLTFHINGTAHQLSIYQSMLLMRMPGYKDYLFLPFKDLSNGDSTYGGGRYLDFRFEDIKNDTLIIDFNKAYNPWCAYSDGYNCPIPPLENHLDLAIPAGEKNYTPKK